MSYNIEYPSKGTLHILVLQRPVYDFIVYHNKLKINVVMCTVKMQRNMSTGNGTSHIAETKNMSFKFFDWTI